jgi:hypothetical protein
MAENIISPLLFLGIGLFILPVILGMLRVSLSGRFYTIGLIVIIVGAFHTMLLRNKK